MHFISMLCDSNGQHLETCMAGTAKDPKGVTKSFFPKRYGSSITGGYLDLYVSVFEGTKDTVILYFDSYHEGPLFIPKGLNICKPPNFSK